MKKLQTWLREYIGFVSSGIKSMDDSFYDIGVLGKEHRSRSVQT